mmetsp:Transcript_95764/g.239969  ORF Transcript_95764/g.239969 Transcript_95764/m.239969 type:complete len:275 (+) Transcript_95764:482-1306(+)
MVVHCQGPAAAEGTARHGLALRPDAVAGLRKGLHSQVRTEAQVHEFHPPGGGLNLRQALRAGAAKHAIARTQVVRTHLRGRSSGGGDIAAGPHGHHPVAAGDGERRLRGVERDQCLLVPWVRPREGYLNDLAALCEDLVAAPESACVPVLACRGAQERGLGEAPANASWRDAALCCRCCLRPGLRVPAGAACCCRWRRGCGCAGWGRGFCVASAAGWGSPLELVVGSYTQLDVIHGEAASPALASKEVLECRPAKHAEIALPIAVPRPDRRRRG